MGLFHNLAFQSFIPLLHGMAPQQRIHHTPPKLYCLVKGCHKELQSKSGFTQHVQAHHRDLQAVNLQPQTEPYALSSIEFNDHSSPPPPDDLGIPDVPHLSDFHDAGDGENFDFAIGSERSGPPLTSSCQTSPSPYDEESLQRGFTKYHPLIYGML